MRNTNVFIHGGGASTGIDHQKLSVPTCSGMQCLIIEAPPCLVWNPEQGHGVDRSYDRGRSNPTLSGWQAARP